MNNIYVDELPKKCKDCPFSYVGYAYDFDEVRFCKLHKDHCMHWIALYNDKFNDCPLKLLKKALAEERKKVVQEIREKALLKQMNMDTDFDHETGANNDWVVCMEDLDEILKEVCDE